MKEIKVKYEALGSDNLRIIEEAIKQGETSEVLRSGGRIVGRRKVSKDLLFLDL